MPGKIGALIVGIVHDLACTAGEQQCRGHGAQKTGFHDDLPRSKNQSHTAAVILPSLLSIKVRRFGFESALEMPSEGRTTRVAAGSCSSRTSSDADFPAGAHAPLATNVLPTHFLQTSARDLPSAKPGSCVTVTESEALWTLTPLNGWLVSRGKIASTSSNPFASA